MPQAPAADYTAQIGGGGGSVAPQPLNLGAPFAALTELGDEIYKRAKAERDKERDLENQSAAVKIASSARIELERNWAARADAATGTAAGLSDAWEKELPALIENYVKNAPEGARDYVRQKLLGYQEQSVLRAFDFEREKAVGSKMRMASDTIGGIVNSARSGGTDFATGLDEIHDAIITSGVPGGVAEDLVEKAENDLAYAHISGLNERNPGAAERLLSSGDYDQYLTPDTKNRLVNDNFVERRRREAEAKAAAAAARQEQILAKGMAQIEVAQLKSADLASIEATGVGVESLTQDKLIAADGEKGAAKHEAARAKARQIYEATADFDTATPDQMMERVLKLRPEDGSETYDTDAKAYAGAVARMNAVLEDRAKDPAGAMMRVKSVADAALAVQEAPDSAEAWGNYMRAQEAAQDAAGVPEGKRRYLPAKMAEERVAAILGANPAARGQAMRNAVLTLPGLYGDKWPAVHRELVAAGLPATSEIFALELPPNVMSIAAAGIDAGPTLRKQMPRSEEDALKTEVDAGLAPFKASLAGAADGGKRATDAQDMVESLALGYRLTGMSVEDAARKANEDFLKPYTFAGSLRVPTNAQIGAITVARLAQQRMEKFKPEDFTPYDPTSYETLYDAQEAYLDGLMAAGRWVNSGDGKGIALYDENGLPARTREGKEVIVTFDELRAEAEERMKLYAPGSAGASSGGFQ